MPDNHAKALLDIHPDVEAALQQNKPIAALESTIITHGMPFPQNVETARQVEAIVRKIIDMVVADGQLDESGITLAEVARVRAAMIDALVSLYHRRISYPGFNPPAVQPMADQDSPAEPATRA